LGFGHDGRGSSEFNAMESNRADHPPSGTSEDDVARAHLDRLAKRYYGPLVSFFRKRARNAAEVHDLVQQVFLRLAQYRDAHTIRDPEAYLFQTASNALKDHFRNTAVRERYIKDQNDTVDLSTSGISTERVLLGLESVGLLSQALRQLPERRRDIFMLRCFEGLKHSEIARLQGISVRAVEKHIQCALAHLSKVVDYGARE
jgi:RNA polymerase sigma factor (sigma-70 family)